MKQNDPVKDYFAREVERQETPPFPKQSLHKNHPRRRDDLLTLTAAAALLALILTPGLYENSLRNIYITEEVYAKIEGIAPTVIHSTAEYFQEQVTNKECSL
jgi:hypothetical protein